MFETRCLTFNIPRVVLTIGRRNDVSNKDILFANTSVNLTKPGALEVQVGG